MGATGSPKLEGRNFDLTMRARPHEPRLTNHEPLTTFVIISFNSSHGEFNGRSTRHHRRRAPQRRHRSRSHEIYRYDHRLRPNYLDWCRISGHGLSREAGRLCQPLAGALREMPSGRGEEVSLHLREVKTP